MQAENLDQDNIKLSKIFEFPNASQEKSTNQLSTFHSALHTKHHSMNNNNPLNLTQSSTSLSFSVNKPQTQGTMRKTYKDQDFNHPYKNVKMNTFSTFELSPNTPKPSSTPSSTIQKMLRLYNPQLLDKITHKAIITRDKYETLFQQFNIGDIEKSNLQNLPSLINSTDNIINSTYSIKYLGINDDQIGILTRRVPFKVLNHKRSPTKSGTGRLFTKPQTTQDQDNNNIIHISSLDNSQNCITNSNDIITQNSTSRIKMSYNSSGGLSSKRKLISQNQYAKSQRNFNNFNNTQESIKNPTTLEFSESNELKIPIKICSSSTDYKAKSANSTQDNITLNFSRIKQIQNIDPGKDDIKIENQNPLINDKIGNNENSKWATENTNMNTNTNINPNNHDVLIPRPEQYDTYIVNQYITPKHLQTVKNTNKPNKKPKNLLDIVDFEKIVSEKNAKYYLRKVNELKIVKRQMIRNIHTNHQSVRNKSTPNMLIPPVVNTPNKSQYSYARLLSTLNTPKNMPDQTINTLKTTSFRSRNQSKQDITQNPINDIMDKSKQDLMLLYPTTTANHEMFLHFKKIKEKIIDEGFNHIE